MLTLPTDCDAHALRPNEVKQVQDLWRHMDKFLGRPPFQAQLVEANTDVVTRRGYVIAFCHFRHASTKKHTTIAGIGVNSSFRKAGLGRILVHRLATASPYDTLILKVESFNPAVMFYERLGFARVKTEPARTGVPMILMSAPTAFLKETLDAP